MKANELMINDLVRCGETLVRISRISERYASGLNIEALEPILLTKEILKANGFYSISDNWDEQTKDVLVSWHKGDIKVTPKQDSMRTFYDVDEKEELVSFFTYHDKKKNDIDIAIEYVHELQHALRLCGLNDLADNFKIK